MQTLTPDQLKTISTICSVLKITKDDKATMVNGFSAGRCTSSKDLLIDEAIDMISHLKHLQGVPVQKTSEKMIGFMLGMAKEMGWTKKNAENRLVADYSRLNEWAVKSGYLNPKKIKDYKYGELPKLVSQFQIIYKQFLERF